ncbi:hypothetical protein [Bacteroides thetaiotaomicron]|uniref:hypothetical protein n=1 Tax=Bacteroides thetaiotaomicron TaxID=818 RepID=UPI0035662FD3
MMKKKILIKDLEDLAKEMPILTENEQKVVVGGSIYLDYNGNELGRFGSRDNFCVVDQETFEYARNFNLDNCGTPLSQTGSSGFSGNIYDIQKTVFTRYAQKMGYTGEIRVVEDYSEEGIFISKDGTNALCLNVARSGIVSESVLENSLEKMHIGVFSSGYLSGDGESEEDRIKGQISYIMGAIAELDAEDKRNNEKEKTQQSLRESYASQLCSLWHDQGHAGVGYEIWDAYHACGVTGYDNVYPTNH